jgi:mono/diheme cytochrome c family protein
MTDRAAALSEYSFTVPSWDVSVALTLVRLALVGAVAAGLAWVLSFVLPRLTSPRSSASSAERLSHVGSRAASLMLVMIGVAISAGTLSAQSTPVKSSLTGVYTNDQAQKGREVFVGSCLGCHTIASHSGATFANRWLGKSVLDFYDYVSRLMPKSAPASLTEDEYVWVTAYVLKLNGMPASMRELSPEPADLKRIRIDTGTVRRSGATPARFRDVLLDRTTVAWSPSR